MRRQASRVTAEEARRQLTQELLELPELFVGEVDQPFVATSEQPPAYETVGVVFVHGVGSQRKGDTLREFATPLVDWVEEWHRSRGMVSKITWAELAHPNEPASAALILPECPDLDRPGGTLPKQRWMLTEALWAPRVAAPEYSTMLSWAWQRLPWLIEGLVDGAQAAATEPVYFKKGSVPAFVEQLGQTLNAVAISVLYLVVEALLMFVLLVLGAIARVPLFGLDQFILVRIVRPLLLENVGDFYVFVYDRIQAVHIRQSIYETVNWLVKTVGCSRVLIAAHSGGTVVAVDALGTPDLVENGRSLPEPMEKVTALVTFGAALNRAWAEGLHLIGSKPARVMPEYLHPPAKWFNFWTHFDWAHPGRPLAFGQADGSDENRGRGASIRVINGLSPISDHGGYFHNYEQFISPLAQLIEGPGATRFADDQAVRDKARRGRVGVLTGWRAVTVLSALGVLVYRYLVSGRDAAADGAAIWTLLSKVPAVGGALDAVGTTVAAIMSLVKALPGAPLAVLVIVGLVFALRAGGLTSVSAAIGAGLIVLVRDPELATALRTFGLGLTSVVAVFLMAGAVYWIYLAMAFSTWNAEVSLLSARTFRRRDPTKPVPTLRSEVVATSLPSPESAPNVAGDLAARTLIFAGIALGLAYLLSTAPAFADIPTSLIGLGGS